jgi:hypothetical protein
MNVGDRVRFIGPAYKPLGMNGPAVGQSGTVTEVEGYTSTYPGEALEQLVTVRFDGDEKASVVKISRLELV